MVNEDSGGDNFELIGGSLEDAIFLVARRVLSAVEVSTFTFSLEDLGVKLVGLLLDLELIVVGSSLGHRL